MLCEITIMGAVLADVPAIATLYTNLAKIASVFT